MKKMKTKLIKIEDIKIEKDLYPRINVDFVTTARYFNAMKSGVQFPPICVATLLNDEEKKYYLVDGAHRTNATKGMKQTHILAEVLDDLTKEQIFVEAIKRNIGHGKQFSTQEVTKICITLEKWNLSEQAISDIVRIPAMSIKPFVAKRIARINGSTGNVGVLTGNDGLGSDIENAENSETPIPLKATLRYLAGQSLTEYPNQDLMNSRGIIHLINEFNALLECNPDLSDKDVRRGLFQTQKLVNACLFGLQPEIKGKHKK